MTDEPNATPAFELGALGHKLREEQEGTPERRAYLERLRKQVQADEYHLDAGALADKLLDCAADEILPDQRPEADEEAK